MDWTTGLLVVGVVGAWWLFKRLGQVSRKDALQYLKEGATVIDVRSPGEFQSGHLERAINVPLNEIGERVSQHAPNKNQVLLVYCLSGTRSGVARRILKQMGYAKVFNLGSYFRAKSIVQASRKTA